jgi:hypothetical protein
MTAATSNANAVTNIFIVVSRRRSSSAGSSSFVAENVGNMERIRIDWMSIACRYTERRMPSPETPALDWGEGRDIMMVQF